MMMRGKRSFRKLEFALLVTLIEYYRRRDLSFFRGEELKGRSFPHLFVQGDLLKELSRVLWMAMFEAGREDWDDHEEDIARLVRLIINWQEGVRKVWGKKRAQK